MPLLHLILPLVTVLTLLYQFTILSSVSLTDFSFTKCTYLCLFPCPISSSFHRIPEGQVEAGSLAAGRLRSLEDQLTRAKQKIHSFQKLTGDGEFVGGGWWNNTGIDLETHERKKKETTEWKTPVWASTGNDGSAGEEG